MTDKATTDKWQKRLAKTGRPRDETESSQPCLPEDLLPALHKSREVMRWPEIFVRLCAIITVMAGAERDDAINNKRRLTRAIRDSGPTTDDEQATLDEALQWVRWIVGGGITDNGP
jgi:hypothetical protein